jgi:DNA-directed RNA polymerase subunit RPC12/RpoP
MANPKKENDKNKSSTQLITQCPHCGIKLSSWEQVLLNVDRALSCKNCWFRIILDVVPSEKSDLNESEEEK